MTLLQTMLQTRHDDMIMIMSCHYYVMILCHSNDDALPVVCDDMIPC